MDRKRALLGAKGGIRCVFLAKLALNDTEKQVGHPEGPSYISNSDLYLSCDRPGVFAV